ncbi:MAG: ammonia-forming cytochrome c nitrite reductase subunit c552 [Kiritimatiellaeota bacterium]|nr:ammonia-forming cytochrome c nitrite reductase subunit c552 [Kiritimatiellota bacterium]
MNQRPGLQPQADGIKIGTNTFRFVLEQGVVRETGPAGTRDYPVAHVMGGKNVYYLLTPLERGKLQVLPVGYDVGKKSWYNVPGSGVRHFAGVQDEALDWTDRLFTFNTACFGCHVSQLATRYDLAADSYQTTWTEPGINCETCHGPGAAHVAVCRAAPTNRPPRDLKIIRTKTMTHAQRNDLCASCHARLVPLTAGFTPGARYYDAFDLVALEHADFYPDGRDLGENYTMTSWGLSPCARAGQLDCVHCHTSSGRYRFLGADANQACLPCHAERVAKAPEHSGHAAGTKGNECVACHMPTTRFANMRRSDHSMRPPMPEAALQFGSPLACLNCHTNRTPAWTLEQVRRRHPDRAYPAPTLHWAGLVAAARRDDWTRLPEMLEYIARTNREEIVAAGLLRLAAACPDPAKRPAIQRVLAADPSPLVRAAAVDALSDQLVPAVAGSLLRAARDGVRVVRLRAALALAGLPRAGLAADDRAGLDRATAELETSLRLRPDNAATWYNLGNYEMARQNQTNAAAAYGNALLLRPDDLPALINLALLRNQQGQNDEAEKLLRRATAAAPNSAAPHLNLGLLLGEKGDLSGARAAYLMVLRHDPSNAVAAYNLGVIAARSNVVEAINWSRQAAAWRPAEPRYAYTHAYYIMASGHPADAAEALRALLQKHPGYEAGWSLLVESLVRAGQRAAAEQVCRQALRQPLLSAPTQAELAARLEQLAVPANPAP